MSNGFRGFKRNKYYPSKLLTADSFIMEQDYYINKRKFINELLYCGGVVSGLRTEKTGSKEVTVSPGTAIDYSGNEIVVDKAEKTYPDSPGLAVPGGWAFLCLEYAQNPSSETFAPFLKGSEKYQNDVVEEKYKLFWQKGPDDELVIMDELTGDSLYWRRGLIYENEFFIITQSVPRYARPGRFFEIRVDVARRRATDKEISVSYKLSAPGITGGKDKPQIEVAFSDKSHVFSNEYNLTFSAFAGEGMGKAEALTIAAGFVLKFGGATVKDAPKIKSWNIERAETDVRKFLRDSYLGADGPGKRRDFVLYLAKVYFGADGIIEKVVNVPFGQYLDSWRLNGILQGVLPSLANQGEMLTEAVIKRLVDEGRDEARAMFSQMADILLVKPEMRMGEFTAAITGRHTYGEIRKKFIDEIKKTETAPERKSELIELVHKCDRHKAEDYITEPEFTGLYPDAYTFEKKDIYHGLGKGRVNVSCGVKMDMSGGSAGSIVTGSSPGVEFSVILDEDSGKFTVRGCLTGHNEMSQITVVWSAFKCGAPGLSVYPGAAGINVGKSVQLQCFDNGGLVTPNWSSPPNSSVKDGLFTSNYAGTYQVLAALGGKSASAVIIVR